MVIAWPDNLERVRESAEDILFSLVVAYELGALQVAANVLLQRRWQVAIGHKLGNSLHLRNNNKNSK